MEVNTKLFGNIVIDQSKVITFDSGIIGFCEDKKFLLIHDSEDDESIISWLQCVEEPELALPVIDPLSVKEDYNPIVEDELFKNIGEIVNNEMLVLTTLTVPSDITKITTNLKAPIIINTNTLKGCQIIVDNEEYMVRYPIYDRIQKKEGE